MTDVDDPDFDPKQGPKQEKIPEKKKPAKEKKEKN
jgi:hypothetical protein